MQGRLSPLVAGRIQAFPWLWWQNEFALAEAEGFVVMEWTLDQEALHRNPLLTCEGQKKIRALCQRHHVGIPSLTGDCFMQAPFWKASTGGRESVRRDFRTIVEAAAAVGISTIVVPLVDNGSIENSDQEDALVAFSETEGEFLGQHGVRIAFECDFSPTELGRFIERLDPARFGINYDIGNSAALGFNPQDEIAAYGRRILNVHVKDRAYGGNTVPLGKGNANFELVFTGLSECSYGGNFILQTARARDGNHAEVLRRYRDMTLEWLTQL